MGKCGNLNLESKAGSEAKKQVGESKALQLAFATIDGKVPSLSNEIEDGYMRPGELNESLLKARAFNDRFNTNSYLKVEKSNKGFKVEVVNNYDGSSTLAMDNTDIIESNAVNAAHRLNKLRSKIEISTYKKLDAVEQALTLTYDETSRLDANGSSAATIASNNEVRKNLGLSTIENPHADVMPVEVNEDLDTRIRVAEDILGARIVTTDEAIKGKVSYSDTGVPVIYINKDRASNDTVFHELIGHVYINAIGGLDNKRVKALADKLERDNTAVWQLVVAENPLFTRDELQLEAIAQAIGHASDEIFNNKDNQSSFERFFEYVMDAIAKLFGITTGDAARLAREGFASDLSEARGEGTFYQKGTKSTIEDLVIDLKESNMPGTPGYIKFLADSHEYTKGGRTASRSVTDVTNTSDFVEFTSDVTMEQFQSKRNIPSTFRMALSVIANARTDNKKIMELMQDPDFLKEVNEKAAELQKNMSKTAEWGTEVHAIFEDVINEGATDNYIAEFDPIVEEAKKFRDMNKQPGVHVIAESRLFHDGTGIAGSVDVIIIDTNNGSVSIYDFKSKKLKNGKVVIEHEKLDGYTGQLALYAAMIEDKYNVKVSSLNIVPIGMQYSEDYHSLLGESTVEPVINLTNRASYNKISSQMASKVRSNIITPTTRSERSSKLKELINERLSAAMRDKSKAANRTYKEAARSTLEYVNTYYELNEVESVVKYIDHLAFDASEIRNILENNTAESLSVDMLHAINLRLKSLNVLEDVSKYIEANADEITNYEAGLLADLQDVVKELSDYRRVAIDTVLDGSTKVLAVLFSRISNVQRVESKDKLILEFQQLNPKKLGLRTTYMFNGAAVSRSEWNKELDEFVYQRLKNDLAQTDEDAVKYWHEYLSEGYTDINSVERYVGDAINSKSVLLQNINKLFSDVELKTREVVMQKRSHFDTKLKEIMADTGKSIKEVHDAAVERDSDGVPTGYLNGKYKSSVYIELNDRSHAIASARREGKEGTDEMDVLVKELADYKKLVLNEENEIKDAYLNPKYEENKAIIDMYAELIDESDVHLGFNANLGRKIYGVDHTFYKLPAVRHSTVEAALNHGLMAAGKEYIGDAFKHRSDDETQEGIEAAEQSVKEELKDNSVGVNVSVDGSEARDVPIYFRGEVPGAEQSTDVSTLLMNNFEMSVNFGNKSDIQPTIELLVDIMKDNRPMENSMNSFKVSLQSGSKRKIRLENQSNEFNSLKDIVENRLYGIGIEKGFGTKTIQAITKYTANTMLIANYMSGLNNLNVGMMSNFLESAGSEFMTPGNVAKSKKLYYQDMGNIMSDIGKPVPTSRTNQLVQYFNIQGEFTTLGTDYYKDNAALKLLSSSNLHFMSSMGEHAIQGQLVYSILEGVKLMNASGEYINEKGETVSKENAASLNDAIGFVDGQVAYNVDFFTTSLNPTQQFRANEVADYMQYIASTLHGQYDEAQKSALQRTAVGAAMMSLRKWVVSLTKTRYKGMSSAFKDWEDLSVQEKSYNEARMAFDEGRYTSFLRFMNGLRKDAFKVRKLMMSDNWNKLNTTQQNNVRKTLAEIAMMVGSMMAVMLLMGLRGDDKEDRSILFAAYLMRRLYSEFRFFSDPREFMRVGSTPAVGVSFVGNLWDLIGRAVTVFGGTDSAAFEQYQKGPRKGQYKINRDLQKVMPIYKQMDNMTSLPDKYKYLTEGVM